MEPWYSQLLLKAVQREMYYSWKIDRPLPFQYLLREFLPIMYTKLELLKIAE